MVMAINLLPKTTKELFRENVKMSTAAPLILFPVKIVRYV